MITAKKLKKMQKMSLIFVMKVEYDDDISPLLYGWGEGYTRSQQKHLVEVYSHCVNEWECILSIKSLLLQQQKFWLIYKKTGGT